MKRGSRSTQRRARRTSLATFMLQQIRAFGQVGIDAKARRKAGYPQISQIYADSSFGEDGSPIPDRTARDASIVSTGCFGLSYRNPPFYVKLSKDALSR